ncbi:MAG TPA: CheR family methyltransferase [Gaiella sp.]|nr:CheR family methyltransferase [Gaiella sp.]
MGSRDESFENVLEFIRTNRGFDFTGYKRPSLQRRIGKRMQAVGIESYEDYLVYLETHSEEFVDLFDTILINVTSFFRDAEAWEYLAREILPQVVENAHGDEVRVWTPGCASGEEAYTIAMLLCEELGDERFRAQVKVYATDVDEVALRQGRHARYTAKQLEPVTAELRERYFEHVDGTRTFRSDLRRNVIFGRHDLIQDPPISRIDLLVVRNALMYFNPETQSRILSQLHFALRDSGFLFLGKSEVLLTRSNLFVPVELRHRIFAKKARGDGRERLVPAAPDPTRIDVPALGAEEHLRHATLEITPVAQIAVDLEGRLVLANTQARAIFGLNAHDVGRLVQDLELSYRPLELRSLIERSLAERHQVTVREVERRSGTDVAYFDVQVAPLQSAQGTSIGTSVTFVDVTRYHRLQESLEDSKSKLETAFEELQSTAEELETTNEELQSTNEELETTNEELQSTNEELETMNEELQSTNEELETINDELRERTIDLHEANAFLESILVSVEAGFVVLDRELRVRTWNDHARELWGLRVDEVEGQHLVNLDIGLPTDGLLPLIRATLAGEENRHQVVLDATNRRGRPIRCRVTCSQLLSATNEVQGAILLMEEVAGTD